MYEIAMKAMFTKSEIFLIRKQHRPFVLSDRNKSEDSSDFQPDVIDYTPDLPSMRKKLCTGIYAEDPVGKDDVLQDDEKAEDAVSEGKELQRQDSM